MPKDEAWTSELAESL